MSTYIQSWRGKGTGRNGSDALSSEFREAYPTLAAVLCGEREGEGAGSEAPRATLNLFEEGGKLKFCILPKEGNQIAFGTIPDPVKGFDAIEVELAAGRFEWKKASRRVSS